MECCDCCLYVRWIVVDSCGVLLYLLYFIYRINLISYMNFCDIICICFLNVQSVEHFVDIHYILYLRYCICYLCLSYTCISVTVIVYAIYIYVIYSPYKFYVIHEFL